MKHWKKLFTGAVLLQTIIISTAAYGIGPYIGDGSGVIVDTATGLKWQEGDGSDGATTRTWEEALSYCENLTLDGSDAWRLPNISELLSIADYSQYNPAIAPEFSSQVYHYWSSTTNWKNPSSALTVYFRTGDGKIQDKASNADSYVRCVADNLSVNGDVVNNNGDASANVPVLNGIWLLFSMLAGFCFLRRKKS